MAVACGWLVGKGSEKTCGERKTFISEESALGEDGREKFIMNAPTEKPALPASRLLLGGAVVVAVVILVGGLLRRSEPPPAGPAETAAATQPGETLARIEDAQVVFRRALWRKPQPDDKVVNAIRREWSDGDGVTRWDWYLVVDPGAALKAWLATNPFSLKRVERPREGGASRAPGRPEWFPKSLAGFEVYQGSMGDLVFIRDGSTQRIYLADSGAGFAKAVSMEKKADEP